MKALCLRNQTRRFLFLRKKPYISTSGGLWAVYTGGGRFLKKKSRDVSV